MTNAAPLAAAGPGVLQEATVIGVVVIFDKPAPGTALVPPDRDLLGAPLLARAVAAVTPIDRPVRVVVAVPAEWEQPVRDELVPRYGLVEVTDVFVSEADAAASFERGAELLGDQPELLVWHDGRCPLVTPEQLAALLAAAKEHGAAALASRAVDTVAHLDDEGRLTPVAGPCAWLQLPQAARREWVLEALNGEVGGARDLLSLLARAGHRARLVEGDRDNLRVSTEADVTRFIEVWARRAVDYPFLWPRPDGTEGFAELQRTLQQTSEKGPAVQSALDEMLARPAEQSGGPLDQALASAAEGGESRED